MSKKKTLKTLCKSFACLVAVCTVGLVTTGAAQANAPIVGLEMVPSTTQAGGHPDMHLFLHVLNRNTQVIPAPSCNCQDARNVAFHLPTGVIGDPHATPRCSASDFGNLLCPSDSQIGIIGVGLALEPLIPGGSFGPIPLYNLVPHPGQAGLVGFFVPLVNSPFYIAVSPRTESDFGLDTEVVNATHLLGLSYTTIDLWGVPASPTHTPERFERGCVPFNTGFCEGIPSSSPEKPFLDNPTTCGVSSLTASVDVLAYDKGTSHAETPYPATTGCDQLSFNPSMFGQPTSKATDSASGLDVDLQVPQNASPTVPSGSEIRTNVLTLPEGLTLNANAADGKVACTDAQAHYGTREEAQCPEASKVGTLTLTSTALPAPIPGYIYIGEPKPGERFRLVLTANGFNVHVKLPATVKPDLKTGRLTVTSDNLPQSPFSDFNLHFFGSERAVMATPTHCGTYSVDAFFRPWDSLLASQNSQQFFSLDSGPGGSPCPGQIRPFSPSFEAGVVDKAAGQHSPLLVNVKREDGDQNLDHVDVSTPPGFSADLTGIPYCPQAAIDAASDPEHLAADEQANPSCPSASRIGSVIVGIGAGSHPFYAQGTAYLAGPYKGAPLSLVMVVPGLSGPYDLGDVVVRVALHVDPTDAHLTALSDPIPQILQGVVLRIRSILIQFDRPNFTINPTNCDPFQLSASVYGNQGSKANFSPHFQVANCSVLPFGPKLSMRMTGGMKRAQDPALHTEVTASPGEANIAKAVVTLPATEQIDNAHIQNPCTRVQYAANACPESSIIGTARAQTPLLDKPLEGPVYLRSGTHKLPDLVAALNGQLNIELVGHVDAVNKRLRTTFEEVPDAPVTKFNLDLLGGSKGLLTNNENLCRANTQATVSFLGQNGIAKTSKVQTNPACAKARHHKRKGHRHVLSARKVG